MNNYLIIMAGGVGTRFWPFSRQSFPKQFHDILGTGSTLIQQTAERFEGICPKENIYVVTSQEYYDITKEQLPFLSDEQILLEPSRRNTAPCIAYACFKIAKKDPNANVVVAPADHIILKPDVFREKISLALKYASSNDVLVTLGIQPTRPDTGYGYIQFDDSDSSDVKKVKTFTEKPNLDIAKMFIASGDYVWNGGIFIWSIPSILKAMDEHLPEVADAFREAQIHFYSDKEKEALDLAYPRCRAISIDNGVMEKALNVYVVLCDIGWSDLGTWKSLYENSEKDEVNNVVNCKTLLYNVEDSILKMASDKLVVVKDLKGYIIAEHDNVLMICPKDDEQLVKEFVAKAEDFGKQYI
ncbi:mannose-1-phosphate guanylyltransferase (GDP) [Leadbetterella byssophila DSM 17132]|uniref:mannose-1-phosphate guanylyltransferase n=1 Tax=Leadbetterella byssophila (strain DSM 17132 / JCM 16389 / KACC 11308 / NBRC 106382 / 4M15) TaxID=649349 RepID=E4RSH1_LEAB4|nr:mannose-1-phosphate guanylyltransferase [Leadbetterella byssophila]ADQ17707.1 mannose-1-phosphate guanylyltransferase (GDP) [Leadbetterella byssophila DSM 17132]